MLTRDNFLHQTASDDELAALCYSSTREVLGGTEHGNRIVKISEEAVIKFGYHLEEQEAWNQTRAWELLDPKIVRVPQVYRFFTHGDHGFIVMEYVKGQIIDPLHEKSRVYKVAEVVKHLASVQGPLPGPLGGGHPRGLLWPQDIDLSFQNIHDIESYVNSRLRKVDTKLVLGDPELVICHLDIAPRNVLWLDNGSICLLDWQSAGFYPKLFEFCGQSINDDGGFHRQLIEYMDNLNSLEVAQAETVLLAWGNQQKYYFSDGSGQDASKCLHNTVDQMPQPEPPLDQVDGQN